MFSQVSWNLFTHENLIFYFPVTLLKCADSSPPRWHSKGERINKMWYIWEWSIFSATKTNELEATNSQVHRPSLHIC